MIKKNTPTILYNIRKQNGKEAYNSFCNGTVFAPKDMKIVGCFTDYMKCIAMTDDEKKHQNTPLIKKLILI